MRFVAAAGFSVILIIADLYGQTLDSLRGDLSRALYPFRYTAELPKRAYVSARDYFLFRENLLAEKQALEEKLLRQTVKLNSLDFFVARNHELRTLMRLVPRLDGRWIAADVHPEIARIRQNQIYLNRGADDGALPGMTVVDEKGVVGQIVRVGASSSEVNLLSNTQQWIAVRVERTGQLAVVRGANDELEIDSMPSNADLRPGDVLRAEGGVFPGGYPVGTVREVSHGVRYVSARVQPTSGFYQRQILLIYSAAAQELE